MLGGSTGLELRLELAERPYEVTRALDALEAFAQERGVPDAARRAASVALDEVLANLAMHVPATEAERARSLEVCCRMGLESGCLVLEILAGGPAFDPREARRPPVDAPLETRREGGVGLHLLRELLDDVRYAREGDRNLITLVKRFSVPEDP